VLQIAIVVQQQQQQHFPGEINPPRTWSPQNRKRILSQLVIKKSSDVKSLKNNAAQSEQPKNSFPRFGKASELRNLLGCPCLQ
jgi:hypothetical protein